MRASVKKSLLEIYDRLFRAYGPQHWWPAKTDTEVVVGAILTQNTAWGNVERAIDNLRRAKALNWRALRSLSEHDLAELIRPSGTFRVKAERLAAFVGYLWEHHQGSLRSMLDGELKTARPRLLSIHGIGPETADAILLYAGDRATFVVDAYTRRVLRRHFLCNEKADYETIRGLFHAALPAVPQVFNEYHALLVAVGKRHCRKSARCEGCPLASMPHDRRL
jgi:endonuclease-3 related protein